MEGVSLLKESCKETDVELIADPSDLLIGRPGHVDELEASDSAAERLRMDASRIHRTATISWPLPGDSRDSRWPGHESSPETATEPPPEAAIEPSAPLVDHLCQQLG